MITLLARFARHDFHGGFKVRDAIGDVGVAFTGRGSAVSGKIHGPYIESILGELVHQRVFAVAGDTKIEAGPGGNG